jgi:hypothetical protein
MQDMSLKNLFSETQFRARGKPLSKIDERLTLNVIQ